MSDSFQAPSGLVAVTTNGYIQGQTAQAMWESRAFMDAQKLSNVAYTTMHGALVDKVRNEVCRQMLRDGRGYLIMVDADMTWPADALFKLVQTAYGTHTWADVVGAYCNLRGEVAICTIDTGTGTWESHYPGSGVLEVMRTGGAFLLVKRHVCERLADPWFAMRVPMRPIDALAEIDSFALTKFDGANPLRETAAWQAMERIASADDSTIPGKWVPHEVGEDSGFCDKVRLAGMRIVVDTNIVTGHLGITQFDWTTHKSAMERRDREARYCVGLLS